MLIREIRKDLLKLPECILAARIPFDLIEKFHRYCLSAPSGAVEIDTNTIAKFGIFGGFPEKRCKNAEPSPRGGFFALKSAQS